jgi:MATE family multidrug resistance protein
MISGSIFDAIVPGRAREGGYREIWRIAYPLIIMSASHTVMQFCDRKFLAMNSTEDVSAALPAGILTFTLFAFFMVTVNFTSALVSQHYGNNDKKACVRSVWNGFYFALFSAFIIIFIVPWIGLAVIDNSMHEPEILRRERLYYIALIPGGAFVCLGAAFSAYFSGQGKTWNIALVNMFSCGLNILLDYLLIFGKLGFPAWGITGAGIATSIANLVSCVIIFVWFICMNQKKYPTRRYRSFDFSYIKKLLSFGSPSGAQVFLDVGAFTVTTFLIGRIDREAMAVTTVALSINMLSFLPLLGLSDATSIVVGQYIGRGKREVAQFIAYRSWVMASLYMILAGAVFICFPEWLIGHFAPVNESGIDFSEVVRLGQLILICAAIFNFFDATKFVFMGALRGAGDTRMVMYICIGCAWGVMVPGVVISIILLKLSVIHVWVFLTCYLACEAGIIYMRFRSGKWKHIKMIERLAENPMQSSMQDIIVPIE